MPFVEAAIPTLSSTVLARPTAIAPWYFRLLVFGATCIPIGALWDISWHSTIGRDTFWTPAHIVTYMGGLIPGLVCGWLALKTHFFGSESERAAAVSFWGFRAPIGAWVTIWGAFTMLLSAPFDDWWHNTYGLDVEILSPPHSLLAAGMFFVATGVLLLMVSLQNRSPDTENHGRFLFIFTGGIMLLMAAVFLTEKSFPNQHRSAEFYRAAAITYPLYLAALARASKLRWPATIAAGVYTGVLLLLIWILPLFPAEPKLAPIYNPVDHMVPPAFPVLLVVPAIGIDLLMRFPGRRSGWLRDSALAVGLALVFLALFMPVQWWFSKFLLSPAADNWFFAGGEWMPYASKPGPWIHSYWPTAAKEHIVPFKQLLWIGLFAVISSRVGLAFGTWMSRVKR
ncbi:MAG: hypothetical protein L0Y58_00125 [Verrucomicrobia subdivision 3 bacterium]|nr:hypothetical protein [Limisphaerales bacterium]